MLLSHHGTVCRYERLYGTCFGRWKHDVHRSRIRRAAGWSFPRSDSQIRKLGAIPPHELPGRGCFTLRNGRDVIALRAPRIDLAAREEVLARLPDVAQSLVVAAAPAPAEREGIAPGGARGRRGEVVVTPAEEARIIEAADQILARDGAAARRVDVCALAFAGATSGDEYQKTKQVLDQHGLLVRRPGAPQVAEVA